ncbi:MAG: hypothetical protein AAGF99_08840 [Bacteroidota bacterium]
MRRTVLLLATATLWVASAASTEVHAQGNVGVGVQIGDITGLTLKLGPTGRAYDFAAAWDFSAESVVVQGHLLLDHPVLTVAGTSPVRWFYGPGGVIGLNAGDNDDVAVGLSFNVGLSYFFAPAFEGFAQTTPRLLLLPASEFDLGLAIGLRFYP